MKYFFPNVSHVLIVDDNPENLQVLGNYLQKESYDLEFALDGKSALDWIDRKNFDLILLDIMMPGMDGFEVCTRLKGDIKTRDIPVIFLTANADTDCTIKAFDLGAADYVTKPFNQKELLARVHTQIEIKKTRDEVTRYLKEVENKNILITSSIKYAKSIQTAVFKSSQNLSEYFSDQFTLILPKDIVSGDFYWSAKVNGRYLLGVFDCTGHGVPGAFMSLLFVTFLNDIVKVAKIYEPHLILNRLRERVIDALEQKGFIMEMHDGMDAALISYDYEDKVIHFSGAFSKMYLIRNDKIMEFKGDRMPVSYYDKMKDFSSQEIKVCKGDNVYMFTDGYKDQFGGPRGKKYGQDNFKKILIANHKKPMETQKQLLYDSHLAWRDGRSDQIDDITIVGFRY